MKFRIAIVVVAAGLSAPGVVAQDFQPYSESLNESALARRTR